MTVTQILDKVYPITHEERTCSLKMARNKRKRKELLEMIMQYKNNEVVNWQPLRLSVDIEALLQHENN